ESRHSAERAGSTVSNGDVELCGDGRSSEALWRALQLYCDRLATDSLCYRRRDSCAAGGRSCAGGASWQIEQAYRTSRERSSAALGSDRYWNRAECCGSQLAGVLRLLWIFGLLVRKRGFRQLGGCFGRRG